MPTSENSDKANKNTENTFTGTQTVENGNFGVDFPALDIRARTDQNKYSRPAIKLDCYGTISGIIFMDIDGTLKFKTGDTIHTITMT